MNSSFDTRQSSFILRAPAKINWSLYVQDKRDDGYHNILSLMHCIRLYDTLIFEHSDTIELITDMNVLPEHNLVYKAAISLQSYAGVKNGVKITLKKDIPLGAGLGGGSSDAAYTLMGLNKLWDLNLNKDELKKIGSSIGSDVPFFFNCPMAIVEGKGDILTPLDIDISYYLLIVKPEISVSTAWAYERISSSLESQRLKKLTKTIDKFNNIQLIYDTLKKGNISFLKTVIHNDFEEVVIEEYPVIGILKEELLNAGAEATIMSGSGSTVFGIFKSMEKTINASRLFSSYWNRVVETYVSS